MATILQQSGLCVEGAKLEYFPCMGGRTWYEGEFVYISGTAGQLKECASSATNCVGMAASDNASKDANTMMPVYVCAPDTLYEVNVYHSTPANATIAYGLVGQEFELFAGTNMQYCNREATTAKFFHVEKLSPKDTQNDLFGRVIVKVTTIAAQTGRAAESNIPA